MKILLVVAFVCAVAVRCVHAASANSEVELAGLTCSSDAQCRKRFAGRGNDDFVCCVTVSCNDAYNYFSVSSGCASTYDCTSKQQIDPDTAHFAARTFYSAWEDVRDSVVRPGAGRCARARDVINTLLERKPESGPDGAVMFRAEGGGIPVSGGNDAFTTNEPSCRTACTEGTFCCVRVLCGVGQHTDTPFEIEGRCITAHCDSFHGTGTNDALSPGQQEYFFTEEQWRQRSKFEQSNFVEPGQKVETSCSTTSAFDDYVALNTRRGQRRWQRPT